MSHASEGDGRAEAHSSLASPGARSQPPLAARLSPKAKGWGQVEEVVAMTKVAKPKETETPVVAFSDAAGWSAWLVTHHDSSRGGWLKIAKKAAATAPVTYAEALEVALAWGWIDGQKGKLDDKWWLQKFTPRGSGSMWSKINRDKAT